MPNLYGGLPFWFILSHILLIVNWISFLSISVSYYGLKIIALPLLRDAGPRDASALPFAACLCAALPLHCGALPSYAFAEHG